MSGALPSMPAALPLAPDPVIHPVDHPGAGDSGLAPPPVSVEARRIASAILDVLAGVRSITEAAQALGITTARYYAWESRAVTALVAACEPRNPGPVPGAALPAEIERLRAERDRLKAEAARYQALARIAQAAFGPPPSTVAPVASGGGGTADRPGARHRRARTAAAVPVPNAATGPKPRQRKRPTVRALRLARQVRDAGGTAAPAPPAPATPPPAIPPASVAG